MKRTTERRRKRARLGLTASPTLLIVALSAIVQLQQATYVQAADQQSAQQARRFELKFQNDLDNSTVIKRPAQQQVFKCQVRLAPIASSPTAASQHRLNFTSSSLTNQEANHRYSQWLAQVDSLQANSMQLDKLLMQSAPEVQLPLNVTRLTIDWLKDGRPLWEAYDGEPLATVNVTLKTRGSDKTTTAARQPKLRLEIKNTLNGQQLKLTSRLRVAQLKASDSGQFKCIARAQFMILGSTSVELVEQSLEASGANLVMLPIGSDSNSNATTIRKHQNDAPAPAAISRVVDANAKTTPTLGQRAPAPQTSSRGYDNEVRHGAESGLYSADHNGNQEDKQSQLAGSHNAAIPSQTSSPFEDDEDLYRLDSLAAHEQLINGQPRGQHQVGTSETLPANDEDNQPLEPQWPPFESAANENGNVNGLLAVRRQSQQQQQHHHHHHHQQEAYLDWILNADGEDLAPADRESTVQQPPVRSQQQGDNGEAEAAPLSAEQQRRLSGATDSQTSPRYRKIDDLAGSSSELVSGAPHQSGRRRLVASPQPETPTSTRSQLAKLVHQIVVPESSCYTGLGELYHGNASQSADQRPCLNWHQVRRALVSWSQRLAAHQNQSSSLLDGTSSVSRAAFARSIAKGTNADENHNYCRNPNGDLRGPWCFVAYSEELDGGLVQRVDSPAWHKVLTHKQQTVRVGRVLRQHDQEQQLLVVARKCQLASCAEYLWLYVVAPPLGLLVLLVCLVSLMIRSIRKSHYNAIFTAAYQRHSEPAGSGKVPGGTLLASGLRKLMSRNGTARLVCTKSSGGLWKFLACGHSRGVSSSMAVSHSCKRKKTAATKTASAKRANYLGDEDIFEIVDDIDWSDGQAAAALSSSPNSMSSPKSSESFRLQHSAGSFTNSTTCEGSTSSSLSPLNCSQVTHGNLNWPQKSTLSHSKSINPMFGERSALADLHLSQQHSSQQQKQQSTGTASKMSKSKSQAGPMFATLRCHVRNAHQQQQRRLIEAANSNSNSNNSNSNNNNNNNNRCQQAKNSSSIKEQQGGRDDRQDRSQVTGHLISCSSSSSSGSILTMQQSNPSASVAKVDELEKSTTTWLASQLPRLDASSVTVAYEAQPIYEGKFSQVSMAYMRQHKDDLAQATGQIGAQVAVCSLKQQAALDENVFYASNLRLRNLNHLNLVKLLGHVEFDSDDHQQEQHYYDNITAPRAANRSKSKVCSLVYDMAHLIDLSDWLKEQSKDAVVARQEEISGDLSLRQNLSCIAKQIALAVDYLHDRNVVFKDLACRNCFLDVTRMLVKLASFNVELEFEANEANEEVVYSVPSSSQTTSATQDDLNSKKLSIKSMVRPKYLFDYYVIDSRPAECQLLPLSWIPLESILFNKFNKQTDIWSFGCLLYELFSLGEVAYFGYSSKQVIDSVRSNLMPPQPLLCPNGIYKLMCKCLSDIPTLRPNIKHTYEQLNLYTGQCSSFLNHHLCII